MQRAFRFASAPGSLKFIERYMEEVRKTSLQPLFTMFMADGRYPRDRVEPTSTSFGHSVEMRSISLLLRTGRFLAARLNSLHSEKELPQFWQYGRISFRQTSDDWVASSHDLFQLLLERLTRGLVDEPA